MGEPTEGRLVDGSEPATPEELFRLLQELSIPTRTIRHPPVFTVEEAKALRGGLTGCHTKNLFLKDKKGAMWLVVCPENQATDLKILAGRIGSGRLSFGSADRLMKYLGVIPGAVTPLAVINDQGCAVRVVLDRSIMGAETLNFHPLDNSMTTSLAAADLVRFLEAVHHPPVIVDFE
jgi:Ala-tRNA(Pro) deacylase